MDKWKECETCWFGNEDGTNPMCRFCLEQNKPFFLIKPKEEKK